MEMSTLLSEKPLPRRVAEAKEASSALITHSAPKSMGGHQANAVLVELNQIIMLRQGEEATALPTRPS